MRRRTWHININGNVAELHRLNSVPFLQFRASVLNTYELTCPNGSTTGKTVRFQHVGVNNIQQSCASESTYTITFDNPYHFTISASAGTGSGSAGPGSGQIEDYAIYVNPHVNIDHPWPDIAEIVHIKVNRPGWSVNLKPFVLPNPVEGNQFDLVLPDTGSYRIRLFTREGVPVRILIRQKESGVRLLIPGKSKLNPGLYILKIKHNESRMEQEVKVLFL